MKTKLLVLSIAALCLSAAPAMADFIAPTGPVTFGTSWDGGYSLQNVLDYITVDPTQIGLTLPQIAPLLDYTRTGFNSSVTTTTDTILESWDSHWMIGGSGQAATTLVIEIAGNAPVNEFGIYDASNSANMATIFQGGATAGAKAVVSIDMYGKVSVNNGPTLATFSGGLFGFFMDTTTANQGIFYSDTGLNTDSLDHMRAYQGNGTDVIQVGSTVPGFWQTDTYVLGWEDLWDGGDRDYQDMVIMVESVTPVPMPAAVLLGVIGLGVVGLKLRKYA